MLMFRLLLPAILFALSYQPAAADTLSIGHRGNSLFAPENTIASFLACKGKADLVELDGRLTSDGYFVVMHDATVDRTTDGAGSVSALTLAQIKALDAGSWFAVNFTGERVPTLEEALTNILSFATPLIEQKAGSAAQYVAELRRLNVISNAVVQSFDWNFLSAVRALEPGIRLGALGSGVFSATTLTNILNAGANMVAWEKASITTEMVNLVHSAGLQLFVWTADGPEISSYVQMGADGVISNDPGMVNQLGQPPTNNPAAFSMDMVAYWKMDDGLSNAMATAVKDHQGTNDSALVRADAQSHWLADGAERFGGCLELNGVNSYVTLPRNVAMDINTNGLSISMWVTLRNLPTQLSASYGAILDSTNDCYVVYLDKSNKELRFKVTDTAGHAARPGIPEAWLATNEWLHIVGTYSGNVGPASGQATIYLNGQPRDVQTGNDGNSPFGLTGAVKSGQNAAMGREGFVGGNPFSGLVDDVAIWRRGLTPSEVSEIYTRGVGGESLGDLLRQPTSLIQFRNVRLLAAQGQLEIDFVCQGPWQTFRLLRSSQPGGPFLEIESGSPVSLGARQYRFSIPKPQAAVAYFRVEAE